MLRKSHYKSILEVPKDEWNTLMAGRGIFDWGTMNLLERSFSGNDAPEENWDFDYIIVHDFSGKPVLATFLTCSLMKDDMLSDEVISKDIEERRKHDPYLLTSRTLSIGSQITEGHHLYLDFESPLWREALSMLLGKMEELQASYGATTLMLRDFPADDTRMDDFMVDNGFFRINLPDTYAVKTNSFQTDEDFLAGLSKRSKRHFKENILRHAGKFEVTTEITSSDESIREYYELYRQVKERSLALNTFALPYRFFENFGRNKNWEIIRISLTETYRSNQKPVAFVLAKKQEAQYHGLLVGFDYSRNAEHNIYRRAIYEVLKQSAQQGCQVAQLGFSAEVEKKKFGASGTSVCAYAQVKDNFAMAAIHTNSVRKIVVA